MYEPRRPPQDFAESELGRWVYEELSRVGLAMKQPRIFVLHVEPAKPLDGAMYYADGSDWDPGSGRGAYRYDSTGPSWEFLG